MPAHCDPRVLHAPKECVYCDMYPDLQDERIKNKINFTGQNDPNKSSCPADEARGFNQAGKQWPGNRAYSPNAKCPRCGGPGFQLFNNIECLSYFCFSEEDLEEI